MKRKISKVRKAELILKGHCDQCFYRPGHHHIDCPKNTDPLRDLYKLFVESYDGSEFVSEMLKYEYKKIKK